jgi:hypothetical protein
VLGWQCLQKNLRSKDAAATNIAEVAWQAQAQPSNHKSTTRHPSRKNFAYALLPAILQASQLASCILSPQQPAPDALQHNLHQQLSLVMYGA